MTDKKKKLTKDEQLDVSVIQETITGNARNRRTLNTQRAETMRVFKERRAELDSSDDQALQQLDEILGEQPPLIEAIRQAEAGDEGGEGDE